MATSPTDKARLQAQIDDNHEVQAAIQQAAAAPDHRYDWAKYIGPMFKQSGIQLPPDLGLGVDGKLYDRSFIQSHPWVVPLIIGGSALTAGAFGAFSGPAVGGTAAAGGSTAPLTAGPLVGGITSTVPGAAATTGVGTATTTALTAPSWIKPVTALTSLAGPPIVRALSHGSGNGDDGGGDGTGLNDEQGSQMRELLQLLIDKAKRTAPVHELAMQTAMRMAPSGTPSAMQAHAIDESRTPRQTTQTDPQVLDAIHRLMAGGGR